MENQKSSGMVYDQNGQQTDYIPAAPFMPFTHLQPTSYSPQLYNQTPVFAACAHQSEGSDMRSAAPNLNPWGLPSGVPSNALARDIPEGTCFMQPSGISEFEEQRKLYLAKCKAARANRMIKRQIKTGGRMNSSGGYSSSSSSNSQNRSNDYQGPRLLLQKVLTSSDVGSNGRIILPKKEAERFLPKIYSKEGIIVVIRDFYSNHWWRMRYGFWENHKGRIYILDQFGEFVTQNRLETGDILSLYENQRKELYFSIQKSANPTSTSGSTPFNEQCYSYYAHTGTPFSEEAMEEENSSLQILMEELKPAVPFDANTFMTYGNSASIVDNGRENSQTQFD